ncbi:PIN domain-containing protein [Aetokthonos hydrillicola Thurmond2011]|uniref:PIN domain-containing protein n=1 Tax=Aetokthonos hydrillicola Thurmond2011 TaxID=2712845 RepID=A0AAP5I9B3_9CYAN|nr:PIN domain-containing protein [Aetokthonos hydrillicola]MBO3463469.1 PIN domain-containing protein [Aetokthonos hydrillicola CCALA 1050]MBW4583732.1 PIN domain-containing protein [Aetokthonos hydrillicola CCALA 1050]MDR9895573.1 PIN domain-containing protein [Aetokthonos hydrillicola Thurmond2011]
MGESQLCFIDSNIWLYRFILNPRDTDATVKQQIATTITNQQNVLISTQVVNEVCSNLIRKAGFTNTQIQILIEELAQGCEILPVSIETLQTAVKLRDQYSLSFWDSLIVASAVLGDASILYSEDMQEGLILENTLQIVNPFRDLNS